MSYELTGPSHPNGRGVLVCWNPHFPQSVFPLTRGTVVAAIWSPPGKTIENLSQRLHPHALAQLWCHIPWNVLMAIEI